MVAVADAAGPSSPTALRTATTCLISTIMPRFDHPDRRRSSAFRHTFAMRCDDLISESDTFPKTGRQQIVAAARQLLAQGDLPHAPNAC
ncbi:hypothetical protein GCM10027436_44050 [Actinophytocola sediminis]